MEAHLTSVLHGVARSMAQSGLKKALSYRAVEVALQFECERDGKEVRLELRTRDQILKDFAQDRVQQRLVGPSFVSQMVEQLEEVPKKVFHPVLPERISVLICGMNWFFEVAKTSEKLWWRHPAILTRKSFVTLWCRSERRVEPCGNFLIFSPLLFFIFVSFLFHFYPFFHVFHFSIFISHFCLYFFMFFFNFTFFSLL